MASIMFGGRVRARLIRAPGPGLGWRARNLPHVRRSWRTLLGLWLGFPVHTAQLSARLVRADGGMVNYGVISRRKLTTAFVNLMVDNLIAETTAWGDFMYHDSGTGTVAEDPGDTGLGTPTGDARVAGTQIEGASANIYKSVATLPYTATFAVTEHGIFNASTGVTLMDRSVFAAINVNDGDSIQFTYELTCNAES